MGIGAGYEAEAAPRASLRCSNHCGESLNTLLDLRADVGQIDQAVVAGEPLAEHQALDPLFTRPIHDGAEHELAIAVIGAIFDPLRPYSLDRCPLPLVHRENFARTVGITEGNSDAVPRRSAIDEKISFANITVMREADGGAFVVPREIHDRTFLSRGR